MPTMQVRDRGQITLPQQIRSAYRLTTGSELLVTPIDDERFEVRVIPTGLSLSELIAKYADEDEAPDLEAEREAFGDAIAAAIDGTGPRP
jgi:bifunctional DNA-binding transcriptional regulator/antitoxin component of YhaV-PrlF toxin-antitoxin module